MRRESRIFAIALFLLVFLCATKAQNRVGSESDCDAWIAEFSAHPSENGLRKVSGPADSACWPLVDSSNFLQSKLNDWTGRGNHWTAEYLAEHLKKLDGGNLEDALQALGEFSERDMTRLLFFAHGRKVSRQELEDALTMLSLSLSDNPIAQLRSLRLRRQKAASITKKELSQEKAWALDAIDRAIAEVRENNPGR